mgnify:CR=1 FL=1
MKEITILSSFYNVEYFISSCVAMLKSQTAKNFSVILVDDGSTDSSYQKCIESIGNDTRFTVIRHTTNKGLGSGRITGIENCKTDYLTYIDPDDYLAPNAVENYLCDIQKTSADYIVYDYFISDGKSKITVTDNCNHVYELFSSNSKLISHVWHKVVKTDLYKKFDYSFLSQISFAEDLFNSINCFLYAKKTVIIHKAYYTYMYNALSLVHKKSEKSIMENIAVNKNLLLNPKLKEYSYIKDYVEEDSFHSFGQLIFPNLKNDFQKKPHFREWNELDSECHIKIPRHTSFFINIYLTLIRKKIYFVCMLFWNILFYREKVLSKKRSSK